MNIKRECALRCCQLDKLEKGKHKCLHGEKVSTYSIANDFLAIFEDKYSITFVFQGSNDKDDWITDFQFKKSHDKDYKNTHRGFAMATKRLFTTDIRLRLDSAIASKKQIKAFGHSYGGALAILFLKEVWDDTSYHDLVGASLGAPRVGGYVFCQEFKDSSIDFTRYEFKRDGVPNLPSKFLGYQKESKVEYLRMPFWMYIPLGGIGITAHLFYYRKILGKKKCK
jgi:predicted lipase